MRKRIAGRRHAVQGFTFIELMVVIVILSILAVTIGPRLLGRTGQAKQVKARIDMAALETALKLYRLDSGFYPTTEQGLEALVVAPDSEPVPGNWRKGGYLEKGQVGTDPWKNGYIYLSPGVHAEFDLISYGADGVPGGEDENRDINSWELE